MLLGLGIAIIVIAFIKKKSAEEPATEVEQMLHQFIDEMEAENERLISSIANQKDLVTKELLVRDKKLEKLENQIGLLQQQFDQVQRELMSNEKKSATAPSIAQRYYDLFQQLEQGHSIDDIAKRSGMGKGEIELILQLAREEEKR